MPALAEGPEPSTSAIVPAELPRWSRATWLWLGAIVIVATLLLLQGLGMGTMRPYDEGLYGKLARNALEHGQYLHAVGMEGELYEGFTKPPLTIDLVALSFHALGVSLYALRLPFALATIALVIISFAWGRRIAGLPMAITWAGTTLVIVAATRWGRVACIEPMLMLWILLSLWAYHEALVRRAARSLAWAALAGLALALAMATKQVVAAIAIVPILSLELWRRDGRAAWTRLAITLGIPTLAAALWIAMMLRRHGPLVSDVFLHTGVLRRVTGFETGHSTRSLNELSDVVAEACAPFPWVLGVAGLVVLVLSRPPSRRSADGALLLPLLLITVVAVYDNASQSMLPWYAFDIVVPLCAGIGFLVAGLFAPASDAMGPWRAIGGALTLAVGAIGALTTLTSQLNVAIVVGIAMVLLLHRGTPRLPNVNRVGRALLVGGAGLSLLAGALRRPELHATAGGHEQLMQTFAARGIARVHVDNDTRIAGEHAWGTYYGPHAQWVSRAPWRSRVEPPQAYVSATIWPSEFQPTNDSQVIHAPGVMALVGDLGRPAWSHDTMAELLHAGPVTFEAEHLPSKRDDTLVGDPEASGGAARALVPSSSRTTNAFLLTYGPNLRIPKGAYIAEIWLRVRCGANLERPAVVVHILSRNKGIARHEVLCRSSGHDRYEPVEVEFSLARATRFELRVQYITGEAWHDRSVVRLR